MAIANKTFTDSKGNTYDIKIDKIEGSLYYSADDVLRMLGYKADYSATQDHYFVNGLRNKASPLSSLPHMVKNSSLKFWNKNDIRELKCYYLNQSNNVKTYLSNWYRIEDLLNEFEPKMVEVEDVPHEGDWYEDGELPPLSTECEYSVNDSPYRWCKLNYIGSDIIVFATKTSNDVVVKVDEVDFRPLNLEKKQVVSSMMKHSMAGMSLSDYSAKLYEAGFRLVEEN